MHTFRRNSGSVFARSLLLVLVGAASLFAQQSQGTLRGQVTDEFGGVVVGATVTATDAQRRRANDDDRRRGMLRLAALAPGRYSVRASAPASRSTRTRRSRSRRADRRARRRAHRLARSRRGDGHRRVRREHRPYEQRGRHRLARHGPRVAAGRSGRSASALQALAGPPPGRTAGRFTLTVSRAGVCRRDRRSARFASIRIPSRRSSTASATVASRFSRSPARTSIAASRSSTLTTRPQLTLAVRQDARALPVAPLRRQPLRPARPEEGFLLLRLRAKRNG